MKNIPARCYYAHLNHPKLCSDLVDTMASNPKDTLDQINIGTRFFSKDDALYINTWVGAYAPEFFPLGTHPSYPTHHKIYESCYKALNESFGLNLNISQDVWDFVPNIEYSKFDTRSVDDFLMRYIDRRIHLFCNGHVRSKQSSVGDMAEILERLAQSHPRDVFVATKKFSSSCENIMFTDDITQMDCDLNEISYLSSYTNLIVGKNSGPFSYATTKYNLLDARKIFVCLSHKPIDCLPYGLDISADFRFSNNAESEYLCMFLNDSIMAAGHKQKVDFHKGPRQNYGTLLRAEVDDKIYMIEGRVRRWIASPDTFLRMGFRWEDVQNVSEGYLRSFRLGPDLS